MYTVPDQPGTYTAKKITSLAIPGQVTDAALRPDGHRLVLLGRGELFILDGNSWADILKATPRQVDLNGAGQTEGAVFKDEQYAAHQHRERRSVRVHAAVNSRKAFQAAFDNNATESSQCA